MTALHSSGHVDVGELDLYYERHGEGDPLVLLHGAMGTIESCFAGLLPTLADHFEVIAVELQGHGHTRDVARPLSYEGMAGDIARLLATFDIQRANVVGYSMGGAVGLELALDRPDLVDHLVFAGGAAFDTSGLYPELMTGFESFDPTSSTARRGTTPTGPWPRTRRRGPASSPRSTSSTALASPCRRNGSPRCRCRPC
jgi:pimeloyl-ACP methyl ester carboxylesterase